MENSRSDRRKNLLALLALMLSLAALQSPLWRPAAPPRSLTARAGGSIDVEYDGKLEKAVIFRRGLATLSAGGPGKLVIHAHTPGKTSLLIQFKGGASKVYDVVVLPG